MRYIIDKHGLEEFVKRYADTNFTVHQILEDLHLKKGTSEYRMNTIRVGSLLIRMVENGQLFKIGSVKNEHNVSLNVYSNVDKHDWTVLV